MVTRFFPPRHETITLLPHRYTQAHFQIVVSGQSFRLQIKFISLVHGVILSPLAKLCILSINHSLLQNIFFPKISKQFPCCCCLLVTTQSNIDFLAVFKTQAGSNCGEYHTCSHDTCSTALLVTVH